MTASRAEMVVYYLNNTAHRFEEMVIVETGTIRNTNEDYHWGDGRRGDLLRVFNSS
jgi:hypothetical protein